jgi:rsbT co-antagonist protein RsbR
MRKDGSRFWANVVLRPAKDDRGAVVAFAKVTRDLTERKEAEKEREQHRLAMLAVSIPVIRPWPGILLVPIIGTMDAGRADQMMETVLHRVIQEQAKVVIMDIAGVPEIDSYVAGAVIKTTSALRLLGAEAVLTGISAITARTMVRMGIQVSTATTRSDLAAGFDAALSHLGKRVHAKAAG